MSDTSAGYIFMANELMQQLRIPKKINHIEDIGTNIFVPLFNALCGESIVTDIIENPKSSKDERHNLRVILDTLSQDILQVSLSHITVDDIMAGEKTAICNLLEIFQGLMEYMLKQLEYENQDADDDSGEEEEKGAVEYQSTRIDGDREVDKKVAAYREAFSEEIGEDPGYYRGRYGSHGCSPVLGRRPSPIARRCSDPDMLPHPSTAGFNSLEHLVDHTLRLSQGALDRGDLAIHRSRAWEHKPPPPSSVQDEHKRPPYMESSRNGPGPLETGIKSKADEEYDRLKLHIKRVEHEASRVGKLAHVVAEQAVQKDQSRREREAYLRRKLAGYLSSGRVNASEALPCGGRGGGRSGGDLQRPEGWFQDYAAECRGEVGQSIDRDRKGLTTNGGGGSKIPVKERLREYVRENEDNVQLLRREAMTAAKRAAQHRGPPAPDHHQYRSSRDDGDEKDADKAVEARVMANRRLMNEAPAREGRAIRQGPAWMRQRADQIGAVYQHQLETVATNEVDALTRSRDRVTEKEEALRRLATSAGSAGNKKSVAGVVTAAARRRVYHNSRGRGGGLVRPVVHKMEADRCSYDFSDDDNNEADDGLADRLEQGRRRLGDNPDDDQLLEFLLGEFPHLHLSQQTIREMWNKAANQAQILSRNERDLKQRKSKEQLLVEEAERRQRILSQILRKEVNHNQRLKDQRERQATRRALKSRGREMRQQHVRSKKYYDEFSTQMRSKMMKKRTKEEQIFRHLFQEALKIQRERMSDMRRYAKDVRNKQATEERDELTSLENYYRDRFAMLADSLRSERNEIEVQEKAQEQILSQMKRELRKKLETDINDIQTSLIRGDDCAYFRQLDSDRALYDLRKSEYRP